MYQRCSKLKIQKTGTGQSMYNRCGGRAKGKKKKKRQANIQTAKDAIKYNSSVIRGKSTLHRQSLKVEALYS